MKTLTPTEVLDFTKHRSSKEPYKMVGHSWTTLSHAGKQYCTNCGIVRVNNEFTNWCIERGCNHEDHPQYEQTKKRLTKPEWEV